jgi:hypothetical protein
MPTLTPKLDRGIPVKLSSATIERLDEISGTIGVSRSAFLRQLINKGVEQYLCGRLKLFSRPQVSSQNTEVA